MRCGTGEKASVSYYASLDMLDAGIYQDGFPLPEGGICGESTVSAGSGGGVSPAYDIKVSVEHAAGYVAAVCQRGSETPVCAKALQCQSGGDELDV